MIGALIRSYYLTDYLKVVIQQLRDLDRVLVLNGHETWDGNVADDDTCEIVSDINQKNLEYQTGMWHSQPEELNYGLTQLQNCDIVLVIDADEVLLKDDLAKLIDIAHKKPDKYILCAVEDYWKDIHWVIRPRREHKPIIALSPKGFKFYETRCGQSETQQAELRDDIVLHHLGYTFSDEKMLWKYENAWHNKVRKDWYYKVWEKWVPQMEDLDLCYPSQMKKAEYVNPPQELKQIIQGGKNE